MSKCVILGIDAWYPQVDGVTNVVVNYREKLKPGCDGVIVAPSYGKKTDEKGEAEYCTGVFHNRSLAVPFLGFRNSTPGSDKKLKELLDGLEPDILHAHSPFAICAFFAKYGKRHGIPVVYTFHTKFKDEFLRITHSRLITAIMMKCIMRNINRVSYVWAVSASSAQTLREYGYKGEVKVMRNGTDMTVPDEAERAALVLQAENEYGISPDERIFMYVGRVVSVKNIKFSLNVIAELKSRGFKCRFVVAGGGDDLDDHIRYAKKLGIEADVIFTGFVGERQKLKALYARADLLLLPSVFDNGPLVMQEAAACGTPAFVPSGSSSEEIIEDGVTGYSERLEPQLWADRIERIYAAGNIDEVKKNCVNIVYPWQSAVSAAAEEYERVIKDYRSRSGENNAR